MYGACGTTDGSEGGSNVLSRGESRPALVTYVFDGPECTGNLTATSVQELPAGCMEGMSVQCLRHSNPPAFAKKDGLTT
jgi:hypothetical protein